MVGIMLGDGGTGYLLHWDIKAFTPMDLVISNFSNVPFLGPLLVTAILGGSQPDVVPLYRGYALHIWFLPILLFVLVGLHLLVVWKQGLMEIPAVWRRRLQSRRFNLLPGLILLIGLSRSQWLPHTTIKPTLMPVQSGRTLTGC